MIWCVEDDASIRDIEVYALTFHRALRRAGFDGRRRPSGTRCSRKRPELVVLDVMLPGDGRHGAAAPAARDARTLCELPVIMATAKGAEYDKIQGLDLGADDYLAKPFGVMELVSRVQGGAAPLQAAERRRQLLPRRRAHGRSATSTPSRRTGSA